MVRHVNAPESEPEESNFKIPSQKEHLFQISDYSKDEKDENIIVVKCEVVGSDEEGLSILHRVNTDDQSKGFYFTRLFLKAIGEDYKGSFSIDESRWQAKQFYATVIHNKSKDGSKTYANIKEYNFEKKIEQQSKPVTKTEDMGWGE